MLPRWHIIIGAVFAGVIWLSAPNLHWIYPLLIFLSSFLIDIDHYLNAAWKTKKASLFEAFRYHDHMKTVEQKENARGIKQRGDFHLFHTVEFILLVGILGVLWLPFLYIFLGLVFHSLLDIIWLVYYDRFYRREFFLTRWLINRSKEN